MTCEIAVMNREAVALAADSAETVFGRKIFPSAEKLFALSRNQPVGIMTYGDANISGVPWETVIKRFREKLEANTYPKLEDYGKSFIGFLEKNEDGLIPDEAQEIYMSNVVYECFGAIVEDINRIMKAIFKQKGMSTEEVLKRIIEIIVEGYHNVTESVDMYPSIPEDYADQIRNKYASNIANLMKDVFENLPIKGIEEQLLEIAVNLFTHDIRSIDSSNIEYFDKYKPIQSSGIVIAGFGTKDTFPSVITYDIEGMLLNHLNHQRVEKKSVTIGLEKSLAKIIPFAQVDMVEQFLYGIDSSFDTHLIVEMMEMFDEACERTIKNDRKLTPDDKERLHKKFAKRLDTIQDRCIQKSVDFQMSQHYSPTMRVLSVLPKEELAMMAETLVNLTSFKRRVTTSSETVGGPIDVAVISRGDGFVWIKRKRYFPLELNPGYTE
jgi:hypothetical protein